MNFYKILQLEKDASVDEIKRSYRKLALIYHPDKQHNNTEPLKLEQFHTITRAYEVLSDDEKRKIYDKYVFYTFYY